VTPPTTYPRINEPQGKGATVAGAALVGGLVGAAAVAGVKFARKVPEDSDEASGSRSDKQK
jgi:hypothetical protein